MRIANGGNGERFPPLAMRAVAEMSRSSAPPEKGPH